MAVDWAQARRPAPQAAATAEDGPKPAFLVREEAAQPPGKKVGEAVAGTRRRCARRHHRGPDRALFLSSGGVMWMAPALGCDDPEPCRVTGTLLLRGRPSIRSGTCWPVAIPRRAAH